MAGRPERYSLAASNDPPGPSRKIAYQPAMPDTAASGSSRGPQTITNGGVAVPSPPCRWRMSSPVVIVAAAPKMTIRETTARGRDRAASGCEAAAMRLGARLAVGGGSVRRRALRALLLAASPALLIGCGSSSVGQLPAPVGPAREVAALGGGRTVTLLGRARVLELRDASGRVVGRAPAGIGPTHVACLDNGTSPAWCWVTDTRGNELLTFAVRAGIQPRRRLYLAGGPDGVSLDHARRRLLVTLRAGREIVELPAHGRPHVLRRRTPTPGTGQR